MNDLHQIVKSIIKSHGEQNASSLTKTKLVKLMYLAEVEYYKRHRLRLTDLNWLFYHYGPYAHEIESILGSPDIESIPFGLKDGRKGVAYTTGDIDADEELPFEIRGIINHIVKDWGDTDLTQLLDHVYFETEPMKEAIRGNSLDFSKIEPWTPPVKARSVQINPKLYKEFRKKYFPSLQGKAKLGGTIRFPDQDLIGCMNLWDDEITPLDLNGQVVFGLEHDPGNP